MLEQRIPETVLQFKENYISQQYILQDHWQEHEQANRALHCIVDVSYSCMAERDREVSGLDESLLYRSHLHVAGKQVEQAHDW